MIVDEPPYDLVALFACADQQHLLERLIERGQDSGCLRPLRWRPLRDPRRDQVCQAPERSLAPFKGSNTCRFLVTWDRAGSGREAETVEMTEADVIKRLETRGFRRENVAAISFDPEVEIAFHPSWRNVVCILAEWRHREEPSDLLLIESLGRRGISASSLDDILKTHPKEILEVLLEALQLRKSPALYEQLGRRLSIPRLKTGVLGRIASVLEAWFSA